MCHQLVPNSWINLHYLQFLSRQEQNNLIVNGDEGKSQVFNAWMG